MKPMSDALDFYDSTLIQIAAEVMDKHPRYADADLAVNWAFEAAKANTCIDQVLAKVCVLNSLYATSVYDVVRMAHHIVSIDHPDALLEEGDQLAVESIRKGHGIRSSSGEDRDFYSFATKYCHFHIPEYFPMWDTLVSQILYVWNRARAWYPKTTHEDLRDYGRFHKIVTKSKEEVDPGPSYKRFDMGLWIIGKYLYGRRFGAADAWVNRELASRISHLEDRRNRKT